MMTVRLGCVDLPSAEASLFRLREHGLFPTRGEAVQVQFARLTDRELAACNGDLNSLKELTDRKRWRARIAGGQSGGNHHKLDRCH
jgi:hypothetical protein